MALHYKNLFFKVRQKINKIFWQGDYFYDWISESKADYFSLDGNFLAVLWNIADPAYSKAVCRHLITKIKFGELLETAYPSYENNLVSPVCKFLRITDYHSNMRWIWLNCIVALGLKKTGFKKEALELMGTISQIIEKHNGVYEVYEKKGIPVQKPLYRAEYPFTWSSGMFVYAYSFFERIK